MPLLIARIVAALAVSFLLGAIPWALVVGKRFYAVDPREHGSGNLGATNVFRVLGARAGLSVLALDIAKGAAAVIAGMVLVPSGLLDPNVRDWVLIGCAMAAILGHSYTPFAGFRGGKGVATAAGGIVVLMPLAFPILFLSFAAIVATTHMISLASVIIAIEYPILMWLLYPDRPAFLTFSVVAAALVIWRHRSNIVRIWRGEESKISLSRRGSAVKDKPEEKA